MKHPNIVPLLGITPTPLQLISEWMTGGALAEYIKKNPDTDRLGLVGVPLVIFALHLSCCASHPTSPRASVTSTPVTWFMGTSRGYVVDLNLVLPPH